MDMITGQGQPMISNKIKIAVVCAETSGGMLHYAEGLASGLSTIAEVKYAVAPRDNITINNKILRFAYGRSKLFNRLIGKYNPYVYKGFAKDLFLDFRPNVVHCIHLFTGISVFVTSLKKVGVPVVLTIHDPIPHEQKLSVWSTVRRWYVQTVVARKVLYNCARIHVHSDLHRSQLIERYGESLSEKIYVVQHGSGVADEVLNGKTMPTELKKLPKDKVVLFFGRIEAYKGLDFLFQAMSIVVKKCPKVFLLIAGAGTLPSIPQELSEKILCLNRFIDDSEIASIFNCSNFVVLPYRSATQTGVVPMASYFSRPCIVTNVGALPELVVDNCTGYIVDASSLESFAERMLDYLNDQALVALHGNNSKQFIEENFSWRHLANDHVFQYLLINDM